MDRTQYVAIGDSASEVRHIDYGVIQGSTLGPVLFLIYVDRLASLSPAADILLFADDTAVLVSGPTWKVVLAELQRLLDLINGWLLGSFLTLNVTKSKYMLIGGGSVPLSGNFRVHSCAPGGQCCCIELERVSQYKYLGVMVDSALVWDHHVSHLYSKLRKFLYLFYHVKPYLSRERLKLLYLSLVQSLLQYGVLVWGGTYPTYIRKLVILQKGILKVMLGKPRRFPSELVFQEAKVFTIRQLFVKNLVLFYHRNPSIINKTSSHPHSTRFQFLQNVVNPRINLTLTTRSPHYLIYIIYNRLPDHLRDPCIVITRAYYKRLLFTWILDLGSESAENMLSSIYN